MLVVLDTLHGVCTVVLAVVSLVWSHLPEHLGLF